MLSKPDISVCVPVYGVESHIERCARSLLGQTIKNVEFIFVNDCTPDRSIEVLKRVLNEYPNRCEQVRIIQHEYNAGPNAARKTAMNLARGMFVSYCDSDDWVDCDFYSRLLAVATHRNADVVCGNIVRHEHGTTFDVVPPVKDVVTGIDYVAQGLPDQSFNSMCNKLYRREVVGCEDLVLPDEIHFYEDMLFNAEVISRCKSVAWCADASYHYVQNPQSITSCERGHKQVSDLIRVISILRGFLDGAEYDGAFDRMIRDAMLSAIKYGCLPRRDYFALKKELRSPLLSDSRHGLGKRGILALSMFSYELSKAVGRFCRK